MSRYRRNAWKQKRFGIVLLLLVLCATFFVSCIAGAGNFMNAGTLEKNASVYLNEPMQAELAQDDARTLKMIEILEILPMGSVKLPSFENASELVSFYRDAILNDLLRDNYSLYTGNVTALEQTGGAYPHAVLTTAIPTSDFEKAVNRCFGFSNVRHKSGEVYSYLNRSDVYTTVLQPWESDVELIFDRGEESEHAYRLYFTLVDDSGETASYCAVFAKRAQADLCLRMLKKIA